MHTITITKSADVPDGDFCADYRKQDSERCSQIRSDTISIGWDAGLGSPGTHTVYGCRFFDTGLRPIWGDENNRGLALEKCERCKTANSNSDT